MHESLVDLGDRWRRARDAALRPLVPEGTANEALLATALAALPDEAHRRVFDNSLRLGRGFARTYGVEVTLDQLRATLGALGVPCLHGALHDVTEEPAFYLERSGCTDGALGATACDFFREAISGLVLGITGNIRHARHASLGHGDTRCIDLLHVDPESERRFGPISEDLSGTLERVRRIARAFDSTVEVNFLGVAEGVLTYRIDRHGASTNVSVKGLVERAVQRKHPELSLAEMSPRPVIDFEA